MKYSVQLAPGMLRLHSATEKRYGLQYSACEVALLGRLKEATRTPDVTEL